MPYITVSKEAFLKDLYNSSSYEDVLSKIQKEKLRVERIKNSGEFVFLAQLHLTVIGEIEFYMINEFPHSERDTDLNRKTAGILKKFPLKR